MTVTQPPAPALTKVPFTVYRRTVFLGDSITDGNTYPSLVQDALRQAGKRRMVAINAGVGGNTAAQMAARLESDVLAHHPTLVTLSAGANDAGRVTPEQFEKDVRGIIERVQRQHSAIILLTTIHGNGQFDAVLGRLAVEYHLRLADAGARIREDAAAGHVEFAPDGAHPGYQGQRMIARAVLDAMGYARVPVPARVHATVQPGVISSWQLRPVAKDEAPLTAQTVVAQVPDHSWVALTLPQTEVVTGDDLLWLDDYRQQGMAIYVTKLFAAKPDKVIGVATITSRTARKVNFHAGAQLGTVWLNGKQVYTKNWLHGWHVGSESVSVDLQKGENTIVIEAGEHFFLSVNKDSYWR